MSDDRKPADLPPKQGYIPRPPSQADIDLVSGQQGMIEDEWTGEPPATEGTPAEKAPPG
jgi:hypothetical protein